MILLQAAQPNPIMSFLPLIGIVVVFYFFFIRPQQKKAKQQGQFLENLNKGDEIATASGIIGRINKIEENTITLQIDQKTFLRVLKATVSKEMTESIK
ncbi:MAG: preprotein translocase subunit YajC [Saprospiraceae bacterium]|nr:preprotein translocase subunit YajC [Saprospiraceae bacterium]